ncbi:hypothetical protein [Streptomyces abikoensis]
MLSDPAERGRTHLPCLAPVFPLTVHCAERADGTVEASAWFDEGAVSPGVAEWFCRAVEHAASQLAARGDGSALAALPVLPAEAAREVLRLGGAGRGPAAGSASTCASRPWPAAPPMPWPSSTSARS